MIPLFTARRLGPHYGIKVNHFNPIKPRATKEETMTTKTPKPLLVLYQNQGGKTVEGIVRTRHRDGSVTVEPRFFIEHGFRVGQYIGGKVRVDSYTPKSAT
jgi:hypothetical protein